MGTRRADGRACVLEDYMMHHVLALADRKGLTVQVHTGLQEGNGNYLPNSNPELLVNLFLEYSNVTFDIFHMSYPYQNVLAALAKNFRNVEHRHVLGATSSRPRRRCGRWWSCSTACRPTR